jgi:hypothetical protein
MLVAFWCELCGYQDSCEKRTEYVLAIVQHKGNTHMYWEPKLDGSADG